MQYLPQVRLSGKGARWHGRGRPWIYRDDVAEAPHLTAGDLVAVLDHRGAFLGQAFYSAASRIALRFVTSGADTVDLDFWAARLEDAINFRRGVVQDTSAYRLLYGEADGFPGLVVDSYAGHLAIQKMAREKHESSLPRAAARAVFRGRRLPAGRRAVR